MVRIFFILGIGLLIAGSLYGLSNRDPVKTAYTVVLTPVTHETIQSELLAVGRLTSSHKQEIPGSKGMMISKVYVREGMFVKKGQMIAEIAKSYEMEELLSRLKDSQIEARIGEKAYSVAKELVDRKAIPENQFQESQIRFEKAKGEVERIASEMQMARQSLSLIEQAQEPPFIIASPQDGTIIRLHLNAGEFVSSQKEEPLVMIADMNRLEVIAEVAPLDIAKIKVGQPVTFAISEDGTILHGEVKSIAQEVSSESAGPLSAANNDPTVRVVCQVHSPSRTRLKLGLMGEVRIVTDVRKNVLVIPVDAILSAESDRYVYVVKGDRAQKRDVTIGMVNQQKAEVLKGLALDEKVITRGQFLLYDQAPVVVGKAPL